MRLRVKHPLVQADLVRRREQQVKVLERLGQPEALHVVRERGLPGRGDVVDGAVAGRHRRRRDDGLEHAPPLLLPRRVARDAVHVPDGLYCFRAARDKKKGVSWGNKDGGSGK